MVRELLTFFGKFFWHFTDNYDSISRLAVLQKPEIAELIHKYPVDEVRIKSLHFNNIEDPFFVYRLLPQYLEHDIKSLVLIETPEGKLVFLDDSETESFIKTDFQLLKQNLDSLTESDRKMFTKNLH